MVDIAQVQSFVLPPEQQTEDSFPVFFMLDASLEHLRDVLLYLDELRDSLNEADNARPSRFGRISIEKIVPVVCGKFNCVVELMVQSRADYLLFAHELSARIGGVSGIEIFPRNHISQRKYLDEEKEIEENEVVAAPPLIDTEAPSIDALEKDPVVVDETAPIVEENTLVVAGPPTCNVAGAGIEGATTSFTASSSLVASGSAPLKQEMYHEHQEEDEEPRNDEILAPVGESVALANARNELIQKEEVQANKLEEGEFVLQPLVRFQKTVLLGKINSLEIHVKKNRITASENNNGDLRYHGSSFISPSAEEIARASMSLTAKLESIGFEVMGKDSGRLDLPLGQGDSRPLRFEVEAKKEGIQALKILFLYNGKPTSELELKAEVIKSRQGARISRRITMKKGRKMQLEVKGK